MTTYSDTLRLFSDLRPGDQVELTHEVKVGFRSWTATTAGEVVRTDRQRHGLHHRRNRAEGAYSDIIVLRKDDGELTTVTLDEFSQLTRVSGVDAETAP